METFLRECSTRKRENFFVMFALDEWGKDLDEKGPECLGNIEALLTNLRDREDSAYTYHVVHIAEKGRAQVESEAIGLGKPPAWNTCNNEAYFNMIDKVHGEQLTNIASSKQKVFVEQHHTDKFGFSSTKKRAFILLSCRCYTHNNGIIFRYSYPAFGSGASNSIKKSELYGCWLSTPKDFSNLHYLFEIDGKSQKDAAMANAAQKTPQKLRQYHSTFYAGIAQ